MFTLPHNTIAYLYKEAIDMRLGMFRLQGVIAEQLSQPMVRGSFFLFINKPQLCLKLSGLMEQGFVCSANVLSRGSSAGHRQQQ